MGCCNQSGGPSGVIAPATHPELFELKVVQNHSVTPKLLYGKFSGRSYSYRKDGDTVNVLKSDVISDPDRYV